MKPGKMLFKMNMLVLCMFVYIVNLAQSASFVKREAKGLEFRIPRELKNSDKIKITGKVKANKSSVTMKLVKGNENGSPDYANVPFQVNMYYPKEGESDKDAIMYNSIVNGQATEETDADLKPSEVVFGDLEITYTKAEDGKIEVFFGASNSISNYEWTDDIKFLTVEGDVDKIDQFSYILG